MGIAGDGAAASANSVYVVSVYRAIPGHRDPLKAMLDEPPQEGDKVAGYVVMQHLEGGAIDAEYTEEKGN